MIRFLDLFAGAGGLSEGFIRAGYEPVAHVEMDRAACFTLKTRAAYHWLASQDKLEKYDEYLEGIIDRESFYKLVPEKVLSSVLNYEISSETLTDIFKEIDLRLDGKSLDLVIGGPPCQAYSIAGRSRSETKMKGDKRNYLYRLYAEFLNKYKPKYFVFENVVGLLSAKDEDESLHFDNMRKVFKECGYFTEYKILNACDFGVLQNRKRVILIGCRDKNKDIYPCLEKVVNSYTVKEVFSDLPCLKAGEGTMRPVETLPYNGRYLYDFQIKRTDRQKVTMHQARPNQERDLKIYKLVVDSWETQKKRISYTDLPNELRTHRNDRSFLDRFKVVADDLNFSQTIVAHIARDGHYYIHPDINQNRSITPREAARIQTFPDDYYFESLTGKPSRTLAYKQIGNAVPVCLAWSIAKALKVKFR